MVIGIAQSDQEIVVNFKDAPLQTVLEYLSESAGFVIVEGAQVDGRITVMSRQPISADEAVALLDSALKEKGYAAIRTGRMLKIVSIEQAVRENLPVLSGNDPSKIPVSDRFVTQIIPVQFGDALKLKTDLTPLVSSGATLTANEASNSLILIDSQSNIRRIVQIIRALDEHMSGVSEVRIFRLKFADAVNAGQLIGDLFKKEEENQGGAELPFRGFRFGRRRGGPIGAGEGGEGETQPGARKQNVVAVADDRTNTLVVSGPPDLIPVIEEIVGKLDSDPTEEQTVFIYALKNARAANLETVLNLIFSDSTSTQTTGGLGQRGAANQARFGQAPARTSGTNLQAAGPNDLVGQIYVVADEDTNSVLVRAPTKHVVRVKEILAELDRPIRQVLIKVLIAEVTHDDTFDLGSEFSALNMRFGASGSYDFPIETGESSGGLLALTVDAGLSATFNALQREGRLDVLSRPYILAGDNQEATITVGQEVPFIRNTRTTETGQTINTIEYEDVGIILTVTPHVNPDGLVIMEVQPEISTVTDSTVPISETVNATVYAKRSASTQVAIHDGQTIVIGGLMEDRVIQVDRKVPGLGDIPLLGLLFQQTVHTTVKTELLIFLTPRVAVDVEQLESISSSESIDGVNFQEHMDAMRAGTKKDSAEEAHDTAP
jgi:general secretion pathway protein D